MSLRLYFEEKSFWTGNGHAPSGGGAYRFAAKKAAKAMNMAYSKAWKMLKGAEKEWDLPLQTVRPGGKTAAVLH